MANPVIKEEESPELPVMEVPPESAIANTAVTLVASGENDIKLPRPMLLSAVERMFSRPSFYYSNSPRKFKLNFTDHRAPRRTLFSRAALNHPHFLSAFRRPGHHDCT